MPATAGLIDRALQLATAHARQESPRACALLTTLTGRRLTLEVQSTPVTLTLESTGIELRTCQLEPDALADARISGSPLSLLALIRSPGHGEQTVRSSSSLRIEGNAEIAQQFRELALLLRPDLEHALSQFFGRSGAHLLMRGLRAAADWSRAAAWTAVQNVAEYLAHERGELVSRAEARQFLQGVDELREQLDRVEARLGLLTQRTQGLAGGREPA